MRTDAEILARIEEVKASAGDFLGTQQMGLIEYLSFDAAQPFLEEGVTADDWELTPRNEDAVRARMLAYMPFAWDKANNCRGISAGRSLDHMSTWLWMLGRDDAAAQVLEYDLYGKPWLRAICEAFEWDWRQWDDGRWRNAEDDPGTAAPETVQALT